ncbi:hypothetical protein FRB96_005281 [Tulasnella sp. 330]|nr:hypothetical protein FRB96_005281 [Tulasnella sp. 330]KAG8870557.1 hypothetical protein FRB97_009653 [Tulasnella sp. 331]KAG8872271.1 hypothetical protein FRB98_009711 [Tulasnella sp. 332]
MLANVRLLRLLLTTCLIGLLSYLYLDTLLLMRWTPVADPQEDFPIDAPSNAPEPKAGFNVLDYVNGPPTPIVIENLRNDTSYITTFSDFGFTNEMMNDVNLIYLAILSSRIPIIPPHVPMHVGTSDEVDLLHFGEVWDIDLLRFHTGVPLLEWRDVKSAQSTELDVLGCWSAWATIEHRRGIPRGSGLYYSLHVDASYTPMPDATKLLNWHRSFHGVAALGFPDGRAEGIVQGDQAHDDPTPFPSPHKHVVLPPDHHLMCIDVAYFLGGNSAFEWEKDYSPAWRFVGKHLRWSERVLRVVNTTLRKLWDVPEEQDIPKYIAIHLRHGDFGNGCNGVKETCFAPLSVIAEYVERVREQLLERSSSSDPPEKFDRVLLTSDEKDPAFWAEVRHLGWSHFDWERSGWAIEEQEDSTLKPIHPKWWPTIIDAAVQSLSTGFVGTDSSTMSLVALRRVRDWHGGVGVMVPFGAGMYPQGQGLSTSVSDQAIAQ